MENTQKSTKELLQVFRETLEYNPKTGILRWKTRPRDHFKSEQSWKSFRTQYAGKIAGSLNSGGYRRVGFRNKEYMAHRIIWALIYGKWPDDEIDHINHNQTDNRLINLRQATRTENAKNTPLQSNNTTGHTGVQHRACGKYVAYVYFKSKYIFLGSFDHINDAIAARKEANKKYNFHPNHGK